MAKTKQDYDLEVQPIAAAALVGLLSRSHFERDHASLAKEAFDIAEAFVAEQATRSTGE